jgi:hypothetical protein
MNKHHHPLNEVIKFCKKESYLKHRNKKESSLPLYNKASKVQRVSLWMPFCLSLWTLIFPQKIMFKTTACSFYFQVSQPFTVKFKAVG